MERKEFSESLQTNDTVPKEIRDLTDSIKFQIQLCQYNLDQIYEVFYNFEYSINDTKNNGLLTKMNYLYKTVGEKHFYVYFKTLLVELGYKIEEILFKEILVNLPEDKDYIYNKERKYRVEKTIEDIYNESGLDETAFWDIYSKAYNYKYGL